MDIYVANLHVNLEEEAVTKLFALFGQVASVNIIRDKETRRSRGFCFVTMPNDIEAKLAIAEMNGKPVGGKSLTVKEAIAKDSKVERKFTAPETFTKKADQVEFIDKDDFEFLSKRAADKEEDVKLENEAEYTKTKLDDGLIKISFKN
jgi:RNA recognition motif-containing protein